MARRRSKKPAESRERNHQSHENDSDESESDWSVGQDPEAMDVEKDDEEEELDKLVLGDGGDFLAQLEIGDTAGSTLEEDEQAEELNGEEAVQEQDTGLEGIDDADLFFLDDGPVELNKGLALQQTETENETQEDIPAWEDSDDDRLMVSLAANPRLRKLRVNEADDMVNGREYTRRLRLQYQRLNPTPEWALTERPIKRRRRSSDSSDSSDSSRSLGYSDEEENLSVQPLAQFLQSSRGLTRIAQSTTKTKLRPEVINIQRSRDIPLTQPSAVTSLVFHPEYPVILSSGLASTLYLHHIDPAALPTPHPLITSVHIKSTALHTSQFLPPSGSKVFFSGRRKYFHTWDLESGTIQKVTRVYGQKDEQKSMERFKLSPCGRYMALAGSGRKGGGIINVLDANTSQWISSARVEGRGGIADFAWWANGEGLTIAGKGGEIGEWSVSKSAFEALWQDEGAVGTTVLTLGGKSGSEHLGGDRWVVIGSTSGIVNIYDRREWIAHGIDVPAKPRPTKVLLHLTTPTSHAHISGDGQLLVIASRWKRDALKLVHLPSCTVYRNWPTSQTPFGKITAVAFSSGSDMLAVANEQGKIKLWEIRA